MEAYWKLGDVLCRQKKFEEGIAALRKAVEIAPNYYPAWQTLAQTLANLGRHDEAIPCYEILLQQPATAGEATADPRLPLLRQAPAAEGPRILDELSRQQPRFAARAHDDGLALGHRSGRGRPQRGQGPGAGPAGGKNLAGPELAGLGGVGGRNGRKRRFCRWPPKSSSRRTGCRTGLFPRPACWNCRGGIQSGNRYYDGLASLLMTPSAARGKAAASE